MIENCGAEESMRVISRSKFRSLFKSLISSRLDEVPFLVLISFLLTFLVARLYVFVTNHDLFNLYFLIDHIYIKGVHVHHLSWGIVIMAVAGFIALHDLRRVVHYRLAILYGIGLGLTFDEFALWLKLENDYYARVTYDAVIVISLILLNIVYFPQFWKKVGSRSKSILRIFFPHKN